MMSTLRQSMKKTLATIAVVGLVFTLTVAQRTGAPPQSGQSIKGADIKGRAPVNKEILKVSLPKAREATLSNGLRVILLESHRVPTFTMQMVILSGGLSDPADYHGLATFTAALLREGTATRKSKDIAEQMDTLGATLTGAAGLSSFAKRALVGSFALSLEQPQALLQNIVDRNLYGMLADYWEVYPQRVMAITADDVQRVAEKYIDLNHMQIVAVGDAKKTREVLAKFGTVEEYDADGKPVRAARD